MSTPDGDMVLRHGVLEVAQLIKTSSTTKGNISGVWRQMLGSLVGGIGSNPIFGAFKGESK
ncbi:hypothetical protein, partial [Cellulomonas carbonis]|uniref:hypothetical protein n=1 Tax=Cellulomonas carbonis TaxID=1386092 RepID=UPI001E500BCB